jgi:hypothetical protein
LKAKDGNQNPTKVLQVQVSGKSSPSLTLPSCPCDISKQSKDQTTKISLFQIQKKCCLRTSFRSLMKKTWTR